MFFYIFSFYYFVSQHKVAEKGKILRLLAKNWEEL